MILGFFSKLFGKIVSSRNKRYDENKSTIHKCKVPVISIGNLSVGGTGKTPLTQLLTRMLISYGLKPGIVGRGYKRESKGEVVICDGNAILATVEQAGDELLMLAQTLRVPIIANDDKTEAAKSMENKFDVDCILVDDGFQHRKLHRDLDIVIIDSETNDKPDLMPLGRLREPVENIKRADVVCIAGGFELRDEITMHIEETAMTIRVKAVQGNPYNLITRQQFEMKEMEGKRDGGIAFAGIAKPFRFYDMLRKRGLNLSKTINFTDHHKYDIKDIERLVGICRKVRTFNLYTTEKDAVKIRKFSGFLKNNKLYCFVFPIAPDIVENKTEFENVLKMMFNK